jgi:hypothetical protein
MRQSQNTCLEGVSKRLYPQRYLTQWYALIIMNDWIQQTLSSSPISHLKIFVSPTTSAPALVWRMFMGVCTFRIFPKSRAVIRFLTFQNLRASETFGEFKSVDKTEALAHYTVKKWRKRFAEGRTGTSLYNDPRRGMPLTNDLAEAISSMLKERPCLFCKVLCRHFRIATGRCSRILHDTLGMKRSHHWVPHALDTNQKAERITLSHGILSALQGVRSTGSQSVITGDESWLFLYHPRDSIWTSSRNEVQKQSVKNWHRIIFNFTSLVCQWNPRPCWCSERQHI